MRSLLLALFVTPLHAVLLPGPPGPHSVSYEAYSLTDNSRQDPYAPSDNPHKRRIMVSTFTPVSKCQDCKSTELPYMPPNSTAAWGQYAATMGLPTNIVEDFQIEYCQSSKPAPKKYPLAIFSPGLTSSRLVYGVQARALASLGYVVISVDHPYDSFFVEFPDGTSVQGSVPFSPTDAEADAATEVRAADVSFLVDALHGSAPGVSLPAELIGSVDLNKIFAYGHSMGGATAAEVALLDKRVLGGLDFDGRPWATSAKTGSDRPFLIVGSEANDALWAPYYERFTGPKMQVTIKGSTHLSFFDLPYLFGVRPLPAEYDEVIKQLGGTIKGTRMQEIEMGYIQGFAELVLNNKTGPLRSLNTTFTEVIVSEDGLSA
ncbi:unnamed protein product [Clonostachys rhizophaga]|uniref:1-alkyl-2-acetylglycerophosphocholine esterase n=1 Tax=Clonostachys rhizophaga TaxID=160324 RepID=A0A9N9YA82_9HYPO|nr:unnamed protein product [Clonostachys rhizophaga]